MKNTKRILALLLMALLLLGDRLVHGGWLSPKVTVRVLVCPLRQTVNWAVSPTA